MARPPKDDLNIGAEKSEPEARLLAALDQTDEDAAWNIAVYKIQTGSDPSTRGNTSEHWLFDLDIAEVEGLRQRLANEYGSGRYRVKAKKNRVYFGQYDLQILTPESKTEEAPAAPSNDMGSLVALMMEQQRTFEARLTALVDRMGSRQALQPQTDPLQTFSAFAQAMAQFQAMLPQPQINAGMDMFMRGVEVASKLNAGDRDTGLLDVLREAIGSDTVKDLARDFMQRRQDQPGRPDQRFRAQPLPGQRRRPNMPQPPAPANPAVPGQQYQLPAELVVGIDYLLAQAQSGKDPGEFVHMISELPEPVLYLLEAQDDPVEFLVSNYPKAAPYRQWLSDLVEKSYADLPDGEHADGYSPDVAPAARGRAYGNEGNAQADAQARSPGETEPG